MVFLEAGVEEKYKIFSPLFFCKFQIFHFMVFDRTSKKTKKNVKKTVRFFTMYGKIGHPAYHEHPNISFSGYLIIFLPFLYDLRCHTGAWRLAAARRDKDPRPVCTLRPHAETRPQTRQRPHRPWTEGTQQFLKMKILVRPVHKSIISNQICRSIYNAI